MARVPTEYLKNVSPKILNYFSPEYIFSENNVKRTAEKFSTAKPIRLTAGLPPKKFALLVPICEVGGKVSLLFVQRSGPQHKGQVSFPGGLQGINDSSLAQTATNATIRELPINSSDLEVWCRGECIVTKSDVAVVPLLGRIKRNLNPNALTPRSKHITEVCTVPLEVLCDPNSLGYTQFRNMYSIPAFLGGRRRIWGLTGMITNMCLSSLLPQNVYSHRVKYIPPAKINKSK